MKQALAAYRRPKAAPGYGAIKADVTVGGTFSVVDEAQRTARSAATVKNAKREMAR